jgi:hypothetical protein
MFRSHRKNVFYLDLLRGTIGKHGDKNFRLAFGDTLEEFTYKKYYGDNYQDKYDRYKRVKATDRRMRPTINWFTINDDSTLSYLAYTYRIIDSPNKMIFKKIMTYSKYDFKAGRYVHTDIVNNSIPDSFSISGVFFDVYKDTVYFTLEKRIDTSRTADMRFLTYVSEKGLSTQKMKIFSRNIPQEYFDKQVYYNMNNPSISYPYLMLPLSNAIIDLRGGDTHYITPLTAAVQRNDPMSVVGDFSKMTYYLCDMIYSDQDKCVNISYFTGNGYKNMKYSLETHKVVYDLPIDNLKTNDVNAFPQFDRAGTKLLYYFRASDGKLVRKPYL